MFKKFQIIFPILFVSILLGFGLHFRTLPTTDPYSLFQDGKGTHKIETGFKFRDIANEAGIQHKHEVFEPSPKAKNLYPRHHMNASISVVDFDSDGKMDLFFTTQKTGKRNFLYRNMGNYKFKDVTEEVGLGSDTNQPGNSVAAVFFDYDNDGSKDLYVAKVGCHKLFKNIKGKFVDISTESGVDKVCAWSTGVNAFDYNRDGFLDLYITNFFNTGPIRAGNEFGEGIDITSYNRNGGPNFLLKNLAGKSFVEVGQQIGAADTGLSWASGFSDFDEDGYPEIYIANDFGFDRIYKNYGGEKFEDVTETSVVFQSSRNGMNAEFGDFAHLGRSGAYVTNVSKLGYKRGANLLLVPLKNGKFKNISVPMNADKCGFSWGAKFADFNKDGWLDLITANGFWNDGEKKYWYRWATLDSLPAFLRKNPSINPSSAGTQMAANQYNCLFFRTKKGYVDVAQETGISDVYEGRGVAVVDLNNSGNQDIVIANHNDRPVIYKQEALNSNHWVGLSLIATGKSNRDAIGAKVTLKSKKFTQTTELFPANSYASQSDPRVYFGLGEDTEFEIVIRWPDGTKQSFSNLGADKYHVIQESKK